MSIPKTLERMGGLQAQYAPSMYIGLWSRLEGFERHALTRALERRAVVQGTMMRSTIHLVSRADYWPLQVASRDARRRWWERVHPKADPKAMRASAKKLRRFLADGPRRRKEIEELLGRGVYYGAGRSEALQCTGEHALGIGAYIDLVRVPPSGTWEQRRADLYALAEDWVGPPEIEYAAALEHLIRRYLGAFGPAPRNDIADWAGIPAAEIAKGLERLRLRRFRDEAGRELLDVPRAPLPEADAPAPPRVLPVWDATLLVHARRTGILREDHRPLDGVVAGTWRCEKGKVALEPFEPLARRARRELEDEAKRLATFHS